jgi:Tfp pilus assembly protein PilO
MNAATHRSPLRGVVIGVALIAGALLGFWLLSDALDQLQRGESSAAYLDETIDLRRSQSANLDAYAQDVAAMRKDLAQYEQQLPDQFAAAEIDAGLHALAQRHGLALGAIERGSERSRDFYASLEHRYELRGNLNALQGFFRDVADVVPIQRITELRITPADGTFVAAVRADYYRYIADDTPP